MGEKNDVRALVITGFGMNCEEETAHALRMAGARPDLVHFNDLLERGGRLLDYHVLCFIGGFSFGDHIAAGTVFANKIKYRMRDPILEFVDAGRLVVGICNGFQTMAKLGLLPGLKGERLVRRATLAANDCGTFRDAWITLVADEKSPCVFTRGIRRIDLPVRHGEGKFLVESPEVDAALDAGAQKALFYADPATGLPTEAFPHNPNGSPGGVAGICDPTGRIFGLMPHPEAFLSPLNHPDWPRRRLEGPLPAEGDGARVFRNAVEFARERIL